MEEKNLYVETKDFLVQEYEVIVAKLTEIQKEKSMADPKVRVAVDKLMRVLDTFDIQIRYFERRISNGDIEGQI